MKSLVRVDTEYEEEQGDLLNVSLQGSDGNDIVEKEDENEVRGHVHKYFNPASFDPMAYRGTVVLGLLGTMLGELLVYMQLQKSANRGEVPHFITDVLIIGISTLELMVAPLFAWLGSRRRRTFMVGWTLAALISVVPLFTFQDPMIIPDADLCSAIGPPPLHPGASWSVAIRLFMLLVSAVLCALAKTVLFIHGLAYIHDHTQSDNLMMHVGLLILHRVVVYWVGATAKSMEPIWVQLLIIVIKCLLSLLRLFRYPEIAPAVETLRGNDTVSGLLSSLGRVVGRRVAVLQMFAMGLLAAAWWGFGFHEKAYVQVKFNILPDPGSFSGYLRLIPMVFAVCLIGFMNTGPIMPKFDRKAGLASAGKVTFFAILLYSLTTAFLSCNRGGIGGLDELTYSQPAYGQNCGCDRPWMTYTPVCEPEQMTTYFSPCHAGCTTHDTVNSVGVYSNCSCSPSGRMTIGACDDGSCAKKYDMYTMLSSLVAITSTLGLMWHTTVILESVDKKDIRVALGLASGVVSLFTFVGGHGFYLGISSFTCAFASGSRCLLQNDQFVPWVGYTSAVLAGLSLVLTISSIVLLRRQKAPEDNLTLVMDMGTETF